MKEARSVPRERTGVLEELWLWREKEAQRRNCPPFKIVNNQVLVDLALSQPFTPAALEQISSLSTHDAHRYGQELLTAVQVGRKRPLPPLPEPSVRPEYLLDSLTLARYDALRAWRSRTAEARGVTPDIVLTNEALLEIARRRPRTIDELEAMPAIGSWKARTYGPAILSVAAN
jgi:ribonuclease D